MSFSSNFNLSLKVLSIILESWFIFFKKIISPKKTFPLLKKNSFILSNVEKLEPKKTKGLNNFMYSKKNLPSKNLLILMKLLEYSNFFFLL